MKTVELEAIRSARYDDNVELYGEWEDTCICCGKRTNGKRWIQYTTTGLLVDEMDEEVPDSQGMFPIGTDCFNKFEKMAQ